MAPRTAPDVDALLRQLKTQQGSDLHLATGLSPRVRVHGFLHDVPGTAVLTGERVYRLVEQVCPPTIFRRFREEKDADFAYAIEGVGRFRVNVFEQEHGPSAVFRLVPERVLSLDELRVPAVLERLAHLKSGLVLVTGPTGAGKSTTLASIVDRINATYAKHVVTIEDPIEFVYAPNKCVFTQREVGRHTPSFAAGLRAAIRTDADVLLVGELRDAETIALALQAAEMGCLVFSTLHTNSAAKTIDRLIDAFSAEEQHHVRLMLSECLAAVVSQVLIPTADGAGRVPVNEVLLKTSALPTMIRDRNIALISSLMQSSRALGMQTLEHALESLVRSGTIRLEDALRRAQDRQRLQKIFDDLPLG